jgi:hypothetical protein
MPIASKDLLLKKEFGESLATPGPWLSGLSARGKNGLSVVWAILPDVL